MLVIKEKIQWPLLIQSRVLLLKKSCNHPPTPAAAANKQLHFTSKFILYEWNIIMKTQHFQVACFSPSGLELLDTISLV